jgi:hypothetical protein
MVILGKFLGDSLAGEWVDDWCRRRARHGGRLMVDFLIIGSGYHKITQRHK